MNYLPTEQFVSMLALLMGTWFYLQIIRQRPMNTSINVSHIIFESASPSSPQR